MNVRFYLRGPQRVPGTLIACSLVPFQMKGPTMSNPSNKAVPWNKGKLVGQKPPLKLKEIWAIRIRPQLSEKYRDLAMFNLAIDSKLRGSDLVKIKFTDVFHGETVASRAMVLSLIHI